MFKAIVRRVAAMHHRLSAENSMMETEVDRQTKIRYSVSLLQYFNMCTFGILRLHMYVC